MFARIVDGIVAEVINFDPTGRYPADWVWHECPPGTRQGAAWDGEGFINPSEPDPVEPDPITILESQVIAERERRLAVGFDYDFGDARGIHRIATTADDMAKWVDEVTPFANALIATGDTTTTIDIVTETGPTQVTGLEWQSVLISAGQFRQPIYAASFALMAADPIPDDFADDGYWP